MALTNIQFGDRVGVGESMASRIRNGQRVPSTKVIYAIHKEFDIPLETLVRTKIEGMEAFGRLLRKTSEIGPAGESARIRKGNGSVSALDS